MTQHGARNITQTRASQLRGFSLGGFGVTSLSPATERHLELMFASKGYKAGGGAEAEETCVQRRESQFFSLPSSLISTTSELDLTPRKNKTDFKIALSKTHSVARGDETTILLSVRNKGGSPN
jgi:hypothetical protein